MHYKPAVIVGTALLPLVTLGGLPNVDTSASSQETESLHLRVVCQSGAVVTLDDATLVEEQRLQKAGTMSPSTDGTNAPAIRLRMLDGGTVSIPWDTIEKIAVGDRWPSERTYPVEVTLKNVKEPKVGKTYGQDNALVGRSNAGEFSIQLKDVKEIVVLPPSEENQP